MLFESAGMSNEMTCPSTPVSSNTGNQALNLLKTDVNDVLSMLSECFGSWGAVVVVDSVVLVVTLGVVTAPGLDLALLLVPPEQLARTNARMAMIRVDRDRRRRFMSTPFWYAAGMAARYDLVYDLNYNSKKVVLCQ